MQPLFFFPLWVKIQCTKEWKIVNELKSMYAGYCCHNQFTSKLKKMC